ncbi:MAG: EamA family transporter [Candidatus Woykebacteria bacterium]
MNWFLIALLSPALHGLTNHIDKYLLSKYFKGSDSAALLIFSSIFGVFILPLIILIEPDVFNIEASHTFLLLVGGVMYTVCLIPYFYALSKDEASVVVPLFQTVPIFGYILAFLVLGETLTREQILASFLIILGAITLSLNLDERRPKLKKTIFFSMLISSLLAAFGGLIFKFVAIEEGFWTSSFWIYIGYAIVGLFLLIFTKVYRLKFLKLIRTNKISILAVNSLNETLFIIGALGLAFASLLAPLALVLTVDGLQPLFVFTYGVIITLFFPNLGKESLVRKNLIQKTIALSAILLGAYLLNT